MVRITDVIGIAIDVVDVVIVCWMGYELWRWMRGTRAMEVMYGLMYIGILYIVALFLKMRLLIYVIEHTYLYLGFGILILFQSEIRRALAHIGAVGKKRGIKPEVVEAIVLAVTTLSARKIGALVVIERGVGLQEHILAGVEIDAVTSYDLIVTIFNPHTPLHDGAVILKNQRIAAAGCFLPLSVNPSGGKELGTRHRAAIGISEETDALAIVVSEETGVISVVEGGEIRRNLVGEKLREYLVR